MPSGIRQFDDEVIMAQQGDPRAHMITKINEFLNLGFDDITHTAGLGSDADSLMEAAIEVGVEDLSDDGDGIEVVTLPSELAQIQEALGGQGFVCASAEVSMVPTTSVELAGSEAESMLGLMEALEELDDVQNVYANFDISDDELARLA